MSEKPSVYLAASYARRRELCGYARDLQAHGFKVTSRWLDENHDAEDDGIRSSDATKSRDARFADRDLDDIYASDVLIAFTEPAGSPYARGGRHVETGIAIAVHKRLVVVGPRENVFHCLPGVTVFRDWEEVMRNIHTLEAPSQTFKEIRS